jgi:hypothetical protein
MTEEKIVEAVFTSANIGGLRKSPLAKMIEHAMSVAVLKCREAGIHDPDEVRAHMLAAREQVKQWFREAEAKASEAYEKQLAAEG